MADQRFVPDPLRDADGADWTGSVGVGENIGAGRYDGPEAHQQAPWKCPACSLENLGPLPLGCVHCGSGKPGYHVGNPPPAAEVEAHAAQPTPSKVEPGIVLEAWAQYWERIRLQSPTRVLQAEDLIQEAFMAGWVQGALQQARATMAAPPVTVDVRELAPHTKAQRTIIAALELFRDQVLGAAEDEIASGEWCSLPEVAELIERLRAQL